MANKRRPLLSQEERDVIEAEVKALMNAACDNWVPPWQSQPNTQERADEIWEFTRRYPGAGTVRDTLRDAGFAVVDCGCGDPNCTLM